MLSANYNYLFNHNSSTARIEIIILKENWLFAKFAGFLPAEITKKRKTEEKNNIFDNISNV